MKGTGRASINLRSSICTDNPAGSDTYDFNSDPTQINQNTGIERNGGVSTIYEQETTFATAGQATMIAKDGTLIEVDASNNVLLDNVSIGNIGPLAIKNRGILPSCLDAAWTADETIVFINRINNSFIYSEYNPATMTVIHSRTIAFGTITPYSVYGVCLIKYVDMHYVTAIELMAWDGVSLRFLQETGLSIGVTITPSTGVPPKSLYAWAFDGIGGSKKLWGFQGSVGNHWIGNPVGGSGINLAFAKWSVFHRWLSGGVSSAFLSFDVFKNAANTWSGFAEVGWIQNGAYSATPTYYGVPLGGAVTATNGITPVNGPGYSETTYTRSDMGTNIYAYYSPPAYPDSITGTYYIAYQTQTQTPANAYGKLDDYGTHLNLVLWRVCMINGQPSYLAAAPIGAVQDYLGVPMTNVGEFDETFCVHLMDDGSTYSRVVYRYNGRYYWINVTPIATHTLQKVSDNLYTVNCLSPVNAIDIRNRLLKMGTNDYNGRMYFSSTAAITTTHKLVAKLNGQFVNSVDTGDKLITQTITAATILEWGQGTILPSFIDRQVEDYSFDYYYDDVYLMTLYYAAPGPQVNSNQVGTLYVADTRLPLAMGYTFVDYGMQTEIETIFTGVGAIGVPDIDYDYLCYELGNDIQGLYQSFYLFGQRYLFDGFQIWLATFNGSLYQTKYFVCPATGLQLIAVSPTLAYFLSTFDNSIYTFDGGRSVQKTKRMNDLRNSSGGIETIINGVYNVRDDTLLLQTQNTFVWVRDGIVTQNNKKATQTAITLYDTTQGIQIANNTLKWIYDFNTRGTNTTTGGTAVTTVVPLTWQSAYHSLKGNELSIAHNWVVTFYHPEGLSPVPITLRCHAFDQDQYTLQRADLNINPSDWDGLGFFRARIQPKNRRALASSLQIDTTQHIVITDVSVEYADETQAVIAGQRSR